MEISLKDLKEIIGRESADHPFNGRKVVAVLPNGFIFIGTVNCNSGFLMLSDASNLRYWEKREGGLPELAINGKKDGDKIDKVTGEVPISGYLFMYLAGGF